MEQVSKRLALRHAAIQDKVTRRKVINLMQAKRTSILLTMSLNTAYLSRQLLLQKRVLQNGAAVEHARNVAILCKLKKASHLRSRVEVLKLQHKATGTALSLDYMEVSPETQCPNDEVMKVLTAESVPAASTFRPRESISLTLSIPINRHSLRELDFSNIVSNLQIRHNLLFEPDMKFQPNVEGDHGQTKLATVTAYWTQVSSELAGYTSDNNVHYAPNYAIVPLLLTEIKAIMLDVMSTSKSLQRDLAEHLDTRMITQQLKTGVAVDMSNWVRFIAQKMLSYCAPCRDALIEDMLTQSEDPTTDPATLFRTCFEILELMKLVTFLPTQLIKLLLLIALNRISPTINCGSSDPLQWNKQPNSNGTISTNSSRMTL
jgi:hypothetical protein